MDEFVNLYRKNRECYLKKLTKKQYQTVENSISNILNFSPNENKLELEAKIYWRRFPTLRTNASTISIQKQPIYTNRRLWFINVEYPNDPNYWKCLLPFQQK